MNKQSIHIEFSLLQVCPCGDDGIGNIATFFISLPQTLFDSDGKESNEKISKLLKRRRRKRSIHYQALSCVPHSANKRHYNCHNKYPNGYCVVPGTVQWLEYFKYIRNEFQNTKNHNAVLNTKPSILIFYPLSSSLCRQQQQRRYPHILQMKSTRTSYGF